MREILFRAKVLETGEWIEGFYVGDEHPFIVPIGDPAREIEPSTLCQFTGLRDKNGDRIWEGDLIRTFFDDKPEEFFDGEVSFHEKLGTWFIRTDKKGGWLLYSTNIRTCLGSIHDGEVGNV